jgi:hypothetical protein
MKLLQRRKPAPPVYVLVKTGEGKKAHLAAEPVTKVLCGWQPSAGGWRKADPDAPVCRMCEDRREHPQAGK